VQKHRLLAEIPHNIQTQDSDNPNVLESNPIIIIITIMHYIAYFSACFLMGVVGQVMGAPLSPVDAISKRAIDGDDAVAYAWAVDAEEKKKRAVDGDDAVAYAWAVDAEEK